MNVDDLQRKMDRGHITANSRTGELLRDGRSTERSPCFMQQKPQLIGAKKQVGGGRGSVPKAL